MKHAIVCLLLLALVCCEPSEKDTAAFCGIWKREFSPLDPNYHLLNSLENRAQQLGMGPMTLDYLMEMFYVERTGPLTVVVYDHNHHYPGKIEYRFGTGSLLVFSTADRDFTCRTATDLIRVDVTERNTKESGTMDFSVRRPFEGEVDLWKNR